uniref:Zinc finger FPG/IleRS-type domain-containing protein n=1 Tax=Aegilops tauschii subsp. strangulata TaxID=200361 RepID=A0A453PS06_AEGTS
MLVNQLRSEVNKILENARTGKLIGASLDAKVYLHAENPDTVSKLKELASATNDADALHRLFITSQVEILPSLSEETTSGVSYAGKFSDPRTGEIWIGVTRADGMKCERCWVYTKDVGSFGDHPTLCSRCHGVIDLQPQASPAAAAVA